ncbi:response regulator [Variovorax sp. J22R24]|uniref:response regulator n=1 Tax=Variovorax gracilis TaxID=3053502 RepID=UPI0025772428|nr:response regulator [Variovorax sp. J22R24]MDM0108822.1 response regulator [Variovorax sp. J22R24]
MHPQAARHDNDWDEGNEPRRSSLQFPVVGLGASAGGMAAALRLLEGLPEQPGMAFVVVLHLSPEHESHAATILQGATRNGGRVEADSEGPGKGAMFRVRLPLLESALGGEAPGFQLVPHQALAGRRILLVDDDAHTLETLGELLGAEGAQVTTAHSAHAALEEARRGAFDVVVSDIGMPGMDGFELIARLRQLPHARRWPAIALTGFGRPEDVAKSKAAGFDLHLNKPISLEALSEAVAALERR